CVSSRTQCAQRGLDNGSSSLQRSPSFPLRGPLGPCVFPFWMALRALCLSVLDGSSGPSANTAPHYGDDSGGVKLRTTREMSMARPRADLESFFHPNGTAIIGRIDGAATVTADELHNRYDRFGTRWYL